MVGDCWWFGSGGGEMKSGCDDGSAVLVGSSMKTMHASRRDTSTLLPAVAIAIQNSGLSDVFEEEEELSDSEDDYGDGEGARGDRNQRNPLRKGWGLKSAAELMSVAVKY